MRIIPSYLNRINEILEKDQTVALTLETPGKLDVHFRANMMAQLVLHCMHLLGAMSWMAPYCSSQAHPHEHEKASLAHAK